MSTSSLSRSNSHSSIDDNTDGGGKAQAKPEQKKADAASASTSSSSSAVPSTSNRAPIKRMGTWSKGYMPTVKAPVSSSDPNLSPRAMKGAPSKPFVLPAPGGKLAKPPSTSHPAPSSSTPDPSSSVQTPSSSTRPPLPKSPGAASAKSATTMVDNRVFSTDLSAKVLSSLNLALQAGADLAPERVGELLVAVESKGGAIKLEGAAIKSILRGALLIRDFEPMSGGTKTDINVIKRICEPFMFRHLDTPELEKARKKFVGDFDKVAGKFDSLSKKIPPKEWTKSSDMKALMDPIMDPVIELVCGKNNTLSASALPDQIKKVLVAIDKYVIDWFQKNGSDKPADLYGARKSALIGFLSTRSLGYVWQTKTKDEEAIDDGHLTKLIAYMNSCVSTQINEFVLNIMVTQPAQPVEARKYIEVMTSKATLKSKTVVPKLALASSSPLAKDKVLSPRSLAPSSARSADSDKAAEKNRKANLMKFAVERARLVDQLAKQSGLTDIDYKFYQYLKETVVKMSRRGFDHFKQDPIKSCIKYADKYYAKIENHQQVKEGKPAKVRNAFDTLRLKQVGNPFEEEGKAVPSTLAPKADEAPAVEDSSETEPSDSPEVVTETSSESGPQREKS